MDISDPRKLAMTFNKTTGQINKYLDEADMIKTYELVDQGKLVPPPPASKKLSTLELKKKQVEDDQESGSISATLWSAQQRRA